jgi:SNF family Na+-dependent transporter
VKSLTLDGSIEGVRYLLQPRVEDISMEGILFALGQSFFAKTETKIFINTMEIADDLMVIVFGA